MLTSRGADKLLHVEEVYIGIRCPSGKRDFFCLLAKECLFTRVTHTFLENIIMMELNNDVHVDHLTK